MRKSSLYLTDRIKAALADRANRTGRSEAEIIRSAIEAALATDPATHHVGAARRDPAVPGRLVGIGVGPGDPDLLTTRAIAALRRADRVIAPTTAVDAVGRAETIVRQAVPGLRVERVPFAMAPTRRARDRSIDQAADAVAAHLDAGEEVAWITLGDPLTYSTFSSIAERVRRKRPATTVIQVPGIMAFQALAARTGTVIADDHTRVAIRTALDDDDPYRRPRRSGHHSRHLQGRPTVAATRRGRRRPPRQPGRFGRRRAARACPVSVSAPSPRWPLTARRPTWPP